MVQATPCSAHQVSTADSASASSWATARSPSSGESALVKRLVEEKAINRLMPRAFSPGRAAGSSQIGDSENTVATAGR